MNRCHWARCVLLAALAGLFSGCANDAADDEPDSGLRVVLRMNHPSVQTSLNHLAEVAGTAFLMTDGGDVVPNAHLHLSCERGGSFVFPFGSISTRPMPPAPSNLPTSPMAPTVRVCDGCAPMPDPPRRSTTYASMLPTGTLAPSNSLRPPTPSTSAITPRM